MICCGLSGLLTRRVFVCLKLAAALDPTFSVTNLSISLLGHHFIKLPAPP